MSHRQPHSLTHVAVALALGAVLACGGDDKGEPDNPPQAFCQALSASWCDRYYDCYGPDQIAEDGLPVDVAECYREIELRLNCEEVNQVNACRSGRVFDSGAGTQCVAAVGDSVCSQLASPGSVDDSCEVCIEPDSSCPTPCDLSDPSSCPEGLSCRTDPMCGTRCLVSEGTGRALDSCTKHADCADGHLCTGRDSNFCVRLCDDGDECDTGECVLQYGELTACSDNCQIGVDDSCPRNLTCRFFSATTSFCQIAGPKSEGQACEFYECGEGMQCLSGTCYKLCEVGLGLECTLDQDCGSLEPAVLVNGIEIGACI